MNILCVIPARLNSTRLPRKMLEKIGDKPVIQHTYEAAIRCPDINKVIIATDSQEIVTAINAFGGDYLITDSNIQTGSDRVAAVARQVDNVDVVINLQGDEPFIQPEMLSTLVQPFYHDPTLQMATVGAPLNFAEEYHSPDTVKVLYDKFNNAIYFSRAPLPFLRNKNVNYLPVLQHIGLYAFRKDFLPIYTSLEQSPLELAESLEQLRALENGIKIRVSPVKSKTLEINTPEELARAREYYNANLSQSYK